MKRRATQVVRKPFDGAKTAYHANWSDAYVKCSALLWRTIQERAADSDDDREALFLRWANGV